MSACRAQQLAVSAKGLEIVRLAKALKIARLAKALKIARLAKALKIARLAKALKSGRSAQKNRALAFAKSNRLHVAESDAVNGGRDRCIDRNRYHLRAPRASGDRWKDRSDLYLEQINQIG